MALVLRWPIRSGTNISTTVCSIIKDMNQVSSSCGDYFPSFLPFTTTTACYCWADADALILIFLVNVWCSWFHRQHAPPRTNFMCFPPSTLLLVIVSLITHTVVVNSWWCLLILLDQCVSSRLMWMSVY